MQLPLRPRTVVAVALVAIAGLSAFAPGASAATVQTKVVFRKGTALRWVPRTVPPIPLARAATVRALLAGPGRWEAASGARTAFQPNTHLLGWLVKDGIARMNFDMAFRAYGFRPMGAASGPTKGMVRMRQLAATLHQFPVIRYFRITVAGQPIPPSVWHAWGFNAPPANGSWPIGRFAAAPIRLIVVTPWTNTSAAATRAIQSRLAALGWMSSSDVSGVRSYLMSQAVTAFQAWSGIARDGSVGQVTWLRLQSAVRPKARIRSAGDHVEIYRSLGVMLLVRNGVVWRAIHTSTGAPGRETPAGTFSVYRKETLSWSIQFKVWMPWASYFNGGIAMHEYPDVPAYPASHGCVRLPHGEAKRVYDFAGMGTSVTVY